MTYGPDQDSGHWCPRHKGVWVVPEEPCHLCVAEEAVQDRFLVAHEFRVSSRYLAIGFNLSFCSSDIDEPRSLTFHISALIFHYDLTVEWQ